MIYFVQEENLIGLSRNGDIEILFFKHSENFAKLITKSLIYK